MRENPKMPNKPVVRSVENLSAQKLASSAESSLDCAHGDNQKHNAVIVSRQRKILGKLTVIRADGSETKHGLFPRVGSKATKLDYALAALKERHINNVFVLPVKLLIRESIELLKVIQKKIKQLEKYGLELIGQKLNYGWKRTHYSSYESQLVL